MKIRNAKIIVFSVSRLKYLFELLIFTFISNIAICQSPSFKTYMNPVIPGDHPDCTLTKVGKYFYTTGSSFNPTPVIYRSTDLVHWEALSQPVSASWSGYSDSPGGGCWGGHVVYYNNYWWDYFSRGNIMHFVKASAPEGPWSEPVRVNNPSTLPFGLGYDNSIFIDDDNKWYLVVKNGEPNNAIVELGNNGQPTGTVYNLNWLNPLPTKRYSWAEGPVMWKDNGYYYYSFALNTAGGQKVMRSKTLTADESAWEFLGDLFNEKDPKKGSALFVNPNHSSPAIKLEDGTSWVLHPVYIKNDWVGQGRTGLLNQLRYNANGVPVADYPIDQPFEAPKLSSSGIPWMVPKSDFFNSEKLNPEWSFIGYTPKTKQSLTDRPGWLRMSPKNASKPNTIVKNDGEKNYSLITRLDFSPKSAKDEAGLRIVRGDNTMFAKIYSSLSTDNKKIIGYSFQDKIFEVENTIGDTLWVKLVRTHHKFTGFYSGDGEKWIQIGNEFDVSVIDNYTDIVTWSYWEGTRQGVYVAGSTNAYFDLYIYRDAYTPILAECTANQYGTTKGAFNQGIRNLDNIHNNDWALYAGVEFGEGDYYGKADSVVFTASTANLGGKVEVWLDSIDTGTKISDCEIETTAGWSDFQTFSSPVSNVKGRHDVYLKFVGEGTDKLFQLKWIRFTQGEKSTSSGLKEMKNTLTVYPNPAKDFISVDCSFKFHSVKIFNLTGKCVYSESLKFANDKAGLSLNLEKGIYILKAFNNTEAKFSRFLIE